jgi:hypothetical protein
VTRPASTATTRRLDPAASSRADLPMLLLALTAAAASIAALLLDWVGWIRMPYTISFVTFPGMVLLVVLTVWAKRADRRILFNRLSVGAVGGLLGLIAYDAIRWLVQIVLPVRYDAFIAFSIFGRLMTGGPGDSGVTLAAGWAYHITNGLTFGIIYALLAGPARWWWGLIWGGALELAMMVVYPSLVRPASMSDFVAVSVIGHTVFGAVVGRWCERHAVRVRT